MSLNVVLLQPEIPQNTGNIARTCACVGAGLHLVQPLGFQLTGRNIRRSGMDYFEHVRLVRWASDAEFFAAHGDDDLFLFTGRAQRPFHDARYETGAGRDAYLVFGRESTGIDTAILERHPDRCVRIPMLPGQRSLNLSNAVAVALYEALRQLGYPSLA